MARVIEADASACDLGLQRGIFVLMEGPRQPGKVKHDFLDSLIAAVNGVLLKAL